MKRQAEKKTKSKQFIRRCKSLSYPFSLNKLLFVLVRFTRERVEDKEVRIGFLSLCVFDIEVYMRLGPAPVSLIFTVSCRGRGGGFASFPLEGCDPELQLFLGSHYYDYSTKSLSSLAAACDARHFSPVSSSLRELSSFSNATGKCPSCSTSAAALYILGAAELHGRTPHFAPSDAKGEVVTHVRIKKKKKENTFVNPFRGAVASLDVHGLAL